MPVEAFVGLTDQFPIEPPSAAARPVARHQKHGAAHGIEREGDPPLPACRLPR